MSLSKRTPKGTPKRTSVSNETSDLSHRVLAMSRQGMSRAAIAGELGIGPRVVQRIERAAGIQRSPGQPRKGDAKLRRVLAYVEPETLEEIERRANKAGSALSDWVRGALERAVAEAG